MALTLVDALFASVALSGVVLCWLSVDTYRSWDEPGLQTFVLTVGILGVGAVVGAVVGFTGVVARDTLLWQIPLVVAFFLAGLGWAGPSSHYSTPASGPTPPR